MPADALFAPIVVPDDLLDATSGHAWVRAMLDAEAALARAEAACGVLPEGVATAISETCETIEIEPAELGVAARGGGNPVIPLVARLRAAAPGDAGDHVHHGATSQDILDTAAMLVAKRSTAITLAELARLADECAALAERHRTTVMAGRTLLQQAVPVTFGLKAAGWLMGVLDAARLLTDARARLAAQLGGAAGTLASLGADGPAVASHFAEELGLADPVIPWHTARQRTAELAAALGIVAGTAAKIAGDIVLLAQTEVGEVAEAPAHGKGGSSAMPNKQNPVHAIAARSAAARAVAVVPLVLDAMAAEHERAAGGWQAEWPALGELLALSGGAVANAASSLAGLVVDAGAMARHLDLGGGSLLAERIAAALAPELGRAAAVERVEVAARAESAFDAALREDPVVVAALGPERLAELLDPTTYLGATDTWIDRALAAYRKER